MTKTNTLNLIYISIIAMLCFVINQRTAIYQCAAIFTGIVFIANTQLLQDKTPKAYFQFLVGVALSLPIYALMEVSNTQITVASLLSLAFAGCFSIYITNRLQNPYRFSLALGTSLFLVSIIDGIIMSSYFLIFNVFTTKTIINILSREVLFKMVYAFGVSTIMFLVDFYKARRSIKYYNHERSSRSSQAPANYQQN